MRFSLLSAALVTLLLGVSSASAQTPGKPAQATGNERWCADLRVGNPRCAYTTLEECNKFVRPQQGTCVENQAYVAANSPAAAQNPAQAFVGDEEWCADLRVGGPRCAYSSLEECNKFVLPQQGSCVRNPGFTQANSPAQQQNPARAMVGNEPWCADIRVGQPNCGYATLAQCQQAVRPQQGQCIRNPNITTGSAPQ